MVINLSSSVTSVYRDLYNVLLIECSGHTHTHTQHTHTLHTHTINSSEKAHKHIIIISIAGIDTNLLYNSSS